MRETKPIPEQPLFEPLIAYHKEPRFFVSYRNYDVRSGPFRNVYRIGAVGYGTVFGLYEWSGDGPREGVQIGFGGGLFAQFDLEAPSKDLINADYTVGIPVLWRRDRFSARFALYHQSSHLGDEFLLHYEPERINLSYEAVQLLVARDSGTWRMYGGGEYILGPEPEDLDPGVLSAGVEYHAPQEIVKHGRLFGAVHLESNEEHDWHIDVALNLGLQFRPGESDRHLAVVLEAYDGYAPHGQFYKTPIEYVGLGVRFGL